MRLFRRKPGRHALGAAVTSIPSGPLRVPLPPVPPRAPEGAAPAAALTPPTGPVSARAALEETLAELLPAQPQSAPPRVQLGFRDGTSATLEPGSDQAVALELLAQSLTRRD